ncbi:MAG: NrfD/PsrC family molybdoenzyme membrane anchor subunit [Fimbriimonadales bacterium]
MDNQIPQDLILEQAPLIEGDHDYASVSDKISSIVLERPSPKQWFMVGGIAALCLGAFLTAFCWLIYKGVGVWGINNPSGWGFDIINFVWWIGIGHAGTLISAILLLMRQRWRTSINRLAETMTLFAVCCAGIFPLLHTGRPWVAYYLTPYPNALNLWPQFRSPLVWDVFAVTTYLTVSAVFWYVGLIPDLASIRDKAKSKLAKIGTGILSMGWRGSAAHWHRYEAAYLVLAGLSTPLVLSVHSIVSFDFAVSIVPGWHTTIFPPYFVAGAVFAGFAMVLILVIPIRKWYGVADFVTMRHMDWMAKIMLATGLVVFYGYIMEMYYAFYSGNRFEIALAENRLSGPYATWYYWLIFCNGLAPQILWIKKMRHSLLCLFIVSLIVSVGMWLERFVIIPVSLSRDYMPSAWGGYTPTVLWGDVMFFFGTFGIFLGGMVAFVRLLPMIPMSEIKHLLHLEKHDAGHHPPAKPSVAEVEA